MKTFHSQRTLVLCALAIVAVCTLPLVALAQNTTPMAASATGMSNAKMGSQAEHPRDMKGSMMVGMEGMQRMPMSGDIDKDFAAMMKLHHQQAVNMAQMEIANGKSPEMKAMAQQIIVAQRKEIEQFDQWLAKQK